MNFVRSLIESSIVRKTIIALYLLIYLITGINTELKQIELFPIPEHLLQDQIYYNRALNAALEDRILRKPNDWDRLSISPASAPDH